MKTGVGKLWVGLGMVGALLGAGAAQAASLCKTHIDVPGLPQMECKFPSCPTGGDCRAPVIRTAQSRVEFFEPLLRWKEKCPGLEAPCWEIYLDVRFDVAAVDAAGISQVGMILYQEIQGQRKTHTLWANAGGTSGVYTGQRALMLHAPANASMELGVLEACARDSHGNEQCSIPSSRAKWSIRP